MPDDDQKTLRIAEVKDQIARLRQSKPMCSDHWEGEFELMELEDELAELTASPEAAEKDRRL